jgi:hypothetical protein
MVIGSLYVLAKRSWLSFIHSSQCHASFRPILSRLVKQANRPSEVAVASLTIRRTSPRRFPYSSYRYATMASILWTSVLKLRSLTCWLFPASIAIGSVSTHSSAGTSADCLVYAKILNTVGSSKFGRNVSLETICLRMRRISDWNSASGLGFELMSFQIPKKCEVK